MKSLEYSALLIFGNSNAGILHTERDLRGASCCDGEGDLARIREFERVGEQVLHDLLEALSVRFDLNWAVGCGFNDELNALAVSDRLEHLPQPIGDARDPDDMRPYLDMPCFNL